MGENQDAKLVTLANIENIYGIIAMSFKKKPCSTYHVLRVWQLMFEIAFQRNKVAGDGNTPMLQQSFQPCI